MSTFRITIYEYQKDKEVDEFDNQEEFAEMLEYAIKDLLHGNIKAFSASRLSKKTYQKPFWEEN